jgi:hypothetical protein
VLLGIPDVRLVTISALLAGLFAASAGCSSAVEIHAIRSSDAHFERYRSVVFDLRPEAPGEYSSTQESPRARVYVALAAAQILESRGYTLTKGPPDLIVRIQTGRRIVGSTNMQLGLSTDVPYYLPNYDAPVDPPYHGYLDRELQELVEGAFVIDVFDGQTHKIVWHGFARGPVQPGSIDREKLRHATEAVLASFPAAIEQRK